MEEDLNVEIDSEVMDGGIPDADENEIEGDDSGNDEIGTEEEDDSESEEEVVISFENEEKPNKSAAPWVKQLRKQYKEQQKENRELRAQVEALKGGSQDEPLALGPKPTLEQYDYDEPRYESALMAYKAKEAKIEENRKKAEENRQRQEAEWQETLQGYEQKKSELKVKDFADAEENVQSIFDVTQQGLLLQGADDPAAMVYALGKNPARAETLAKIKDPIKFAFAVAKLETKMKINRKAATKPESKLSGGSAPISGVTDQRLERLRAQAEKSGDYTKVHEYKQSMKRKVRG